MGKVSERQKQEVTEADRSGGAAGTKEAHRLFRIISQKKTAFSVLLIALVSLIAYSNTFHVPFVFDDEGQVQDNLMIRNLHNFVLSLQGHNFSHMKDYIFEPRRFIGYLSFALNYYFGGINVVGFHIVNLAIHLINGILVYFLLILTMRTPYFRNQSANGNDRKPQSSIIALVCALFFVSHPVQTQAVTYVVQRLTSLVAMFYLLSIVSYIKGRLAGRQAVKLAGFALAVLSAVFAMKTKEIAFTLPVSIVLYEVIFFRAPFKKRLLFLIPVLLTLIIIPVGMMGIHQSLGAMLSDLSDKMRLQTDIPRWDYFVTELRVIVTYIRLIFFPIDQNLDYDYPVYHSLFTPSVLFSFLFLSALLATAVYLLYKSRGAVESGQWQGDQEASRRESIPFPYGYYRLIAFGILWFFVALSVESSIIPIADVIFEHRVYLPSVGAFMAIVSSLIFGARALTARLPNTARVLPVVLAVLVIGLSSATFARNAVWRSPITLWEDVVGKSPENVRAYNNLGAAYADGGQMAKGIETFLHALQIDPNYAQAYYNLGTAYSQMHEDDKAIEAYSKAVASDPGYVDVYNSLGVLYDKKNQPEKAIEEYRKALAADPGFIVAYNNLATAYAKAGNNDEALKTVEKALSMGSETSLSYDTLGYLYIKAKDYDAALSALKRAVSLDPNNADAYNNLSAAYRKLNRYEDAIAAAENALRIKPDLASPQNNLGLAYVETGKYDAAMAAFKQAITRDPKYAEAYNNLGGLYIVIDRYEAAIETLKEGLKIDSRDPKLHVNLGIAYYLTGNRKGAMEEYGILRGLSPSEAEKLSALLSGKKREGR